LEIEMGSIQPPRNRIVGHHIVRARDLIPHALNPRTHSEGQREALRDLLGEVGFARSTLAYVSDADKAAHKRKYGTSETATVILPDVHMMAPLTLIDGHLRRDELGDEEVTVEVLDVDDEEARKLLLSIDPLSSLAGYEETALQELRDTVATGSDALTNLWGSIADAQRAASRVLDEARKDREPKRVQEEPDRFLVIIECKDEKDQKKMLAKCKAFADDVKAVMS
jgi:hypothetical protein